MISSFTYKSTSLFQQAFVNAANCGVKHEYTQYNCGGTANCGAPQLRSSHFYYY